MKDAQPLEELRQAISHARRIVAFTGAGISTESGMPDFRSPGGIWSRYQPIMFQDFVNSAESRREAWRRKIGSDLEIGELRPNQGHYALAQLHTEGRLLAVITQNIDGLHQKSGIPDELIIEIHGNSNYATCLSCAKRFELSEVFTEFERTGEGPECDACGGLIKTATISFGQPMPTDGMMRADEVIHGCDLFLVLGTSLVVFPAASFPLAAKEAGAKVAIINREPTELDSCADVLVHDELGTTLTAAITQSG